MMGGPTGPRAATAQPAPRADTDAEAAAVLWALEHRFWTEGADSARQMTARDAIYVFADPAGILQGSAMWREAEVAQRWRSVTMRDHHVCLHRDIAILAYRVCAERGDATRQETLCSSTYLRQAGTWLRLAHQQTPA